MEIENTLSQLESDAVSRIDATTDRAQLDEVRRSLLGKKGELTLLLRTLGKMEASQRAAAGQSINAAKTRVESAITARDSEILNAARDKELVAEAIDVTLPAAPLPFGRRHPLMQTWDDIVRIFGLLGYSVVSGPEVETEYYNFDALNIGPDHPARDERDSLFVGNGLVMRTETSAVQIRVMENREPPLQIIAPGRVYRRDAVDRTHSAIFHQVEGLLVGENVTFGDLKGTLSTFLQQLFDAAPGGALQTRFRPHFFPFTEPSAEFDVWFGERWLELGGCGMVHPTVLENVGYDSEKYTGFAFGFGIERMAMIKFGIDDLRAFYENDWRFLSQF